MGKEDLENKVNNELALREHNHTLDVDLFGGYNPRNISAFEGYKLNKNGNNPGIYLVGKRNEKYFMTSWSENTENGKEDSVDGKGLLMIGLVERDEYELFENTLKDSGYTEGNIESLMAEKCYSPIDSRNNDSNEQVILFVLEENPNKVIRRKLKNIREI